MLGIVRRRRRQPELFAHSGIKDRVLEVVGVMKIAHLIEFLRATKVRVMSVRVREVRATEVRVREIRVR